MTEDRIVGREDRERSRGQRWVKAQRRYFDSGDHYKLNAMLSNLFDIAGHLI